MIISNKLLFTKSGLIFLKMTFFFKKTNNNPLIIIRAKLYSFFKELRITTLKKAFLNFS